MKIGISFFTHFDAVDEKSQIFPGERAVFDELIQKRQRVVERKRFRGKGGFCFLEFLFQSQDFFGTFFLENRVGFLNQDFVFGGEGKVSNFLTQKKL